MHNTISMADNLKPPKNEVLSFIKSVFIFVAIVICIRGTVVEAFKIPSGSMIPTLRIGDRILVSKFSYGIRFEIPFVQHPLFTNTLFQYSIPHRTDIVVFTRPDDPSTTEKDESEDNIIKRVIGLPGETVEVRGTTVLINGQELIEPYARWEQGGSLEGNFGPKRVPEGHIFLMGDNRDASKDSRFWNYPFLDLARVKGRAIIIYWSFDDLSRFGRILR